MNFASISAPPTTEPEISGIHPVVSVGDMITGNCTSYHTKPAASLMFYINDEKVRKKQFFIICKRSFSRALVGLIHIS